MTTLFDLSETLTDSEYETLLIPERPLGQPKTEGYGWYFYESHWRPYAKSIGFTGKYLDGVTTMVSLYDGHSKRVNVVAASTRSPFKLLSWLYFDLITYRLDMPKGLFETHQGAIIKRCYELPYSQYYQIFPNYILENCNLEEYYTLHEVLTARFNSPYLRGYLRLVSNYSSWFSNLFADPKCENFMLGRQGRLLPLDVFGESLARHHSQAEWGVFFDFLDSQYPALYNKWQNLPRM